MHISDSNSLNLRSEKILVSSVTIGLHCPSSAEPGFSLLESIEVVEESLCANLLRYASLPRIEVTLLIRALGCSLQ
jgi:hypothetical protein